MGNFLVIKVIDEIKTIQSCMYLPGSLWLVTKYFSLFGALVSLMHL